MFKRSAIAEFNLFLQTGRQNMKDTSNEPQLGKIMRTLLFAASKHRNQRRKDAQASPYINHPIALATILADEVGITDTIVICAALLHDTVEDTETTFDELECQFGNEIASIVMEVTDNKTLPKGQRKQQQVEHAGTISEKARLVKLADKISNLRDIASGPPADWSLRRKQEYFEWAGRVVDQMRGTHPGLEALFDEAANTELSA